MNFVIAELLLVLSGFLCLCSPDSLIRVDEGDCSSLAKEVGSRAGGGPDDVYTMVDGTPACHHTSTTTSKTPRKRQSQVKDVPDQTAHS